MSISRGMPEKAVDDTPERLSPGKNEPRSTRENHSRTSALCLCVSVASLVLCRTASAGAGPDGSSSIAFREVAAQAGVAFRFDAGSRGRHDLPEIMGGGVALIDGDGDGWLDLYFCNGGPIVPGP